MIEFWKHFWSVAGAGVAMLVVAYLLGRWERRLKAGHEKVCALREKAASDWALTRARIAVRAICRSTISSSSCRSGRCRPRAGALDKTSLDNAARENLVKGLQEKIIAELNRIERGDDEKV